MSSLLYGVIGTFLIIYVSFLLLKALGKSCLGCLVQYFGYLLLYGYLIIFFKRE